jgi:2-dehydropantoate 2-reductase
MRIGIFGTGGASGYFGAQLARGGEDVVFLARGEHLAAIQTKGLRVETSKGEILIQPAQASGNPSEIGIVDVVLLGVKAWQVAEAARAMKPMIGPETIVVPLQNGVEAPSQLARILGAKNVIGGLCGTLSWIAGPGHIRSIGDMHFIRFGELDKRKSDRTEQLRKAFEGAGVEVEVTPDIEAALWEKFLFVASFGGIGAVTRAPIGVTRTLPQTRQLLEQSMREIFQVAAARKIALSEGLVDERMSFLDSLPPSGTTSLQRDIMNGKPSELEFWNGAVVRLGRDVAVSTPLHAFIYNSLLPLELRARGELQFPT